MGKKPAEIQHEIEAKRAAISARMEGVQQRVRTDVTDLKHSVEDQASDTLHQTKSKLDLGAQAQEHPLSMLTGALGLGVILGAASEGLPGRDGSQSRSRDTSRSSSNGGEHESSGLGGLMMTAVGPAAETVRDELRELIKDGFSTFKKSSGLAQEDQDATGSDGSPEPRSDPGS